MDIIITIPKKIKWEDYLKEIVTVKDGSQQMMFKVPNLPQHTNIGDRCYLCYQGKIVGYMIICWLGYNPAFNCTTTGIMWESGNYIARSGPFYKATEEIEYKGFQGFRYAPADWRCMKFQEYQKEDGIRNHNLNQ